MNRYKHLAGTIKLLSPVIFLILLSACASKHPSPAAPQAASSMTGEEYYQKAMESAQDESYWEQPFEAFHFFKRAAELGHVVAQDRTGWGYQYGLGTERDLYKAAEWYRKAAEAGNPQAQTSLGFFLYLGLGGKKDQTEALAWTRKAAEQKYAAGLNNMGGIYDQGKIVPQDYSEAARYYRQAAELDYALAKSNLGALYLKGDGIEKDTERASRLFREGCTENNRYGFAGCYNLLRNFPEIAIEEQEYFKANLILEQACKDKQGVACEFLGNLYMNGWWVQMDSAEAIGFFQQGCDLGNPSACGKVGEWYFLGHGVHENKELAEILLTDACSNGDEKSCGKLSSLQKAFHDGRTPESDRGKK
jgi:hypothetical protein